MCESRAFVLRWSDNSNVQGEPEIVISRDDSVISSPMENVCMRYSVLSIELRRGYSKLFVDSSFSRDSSR